MDSSLQVILSKVLADPFSPFCSNSSKPSVVFLFLNGLKGLLNGFGLNVVPTV